jgi:hypothetical protein
LYRADRRPALFYDERRAVGLSPKGRLVGASFVLTLQCQSEQTR